MPTHKAPAADSLGALTKPIPVGRSKEPSLRFRAHRCEASDASLSPLNFQEEVTVSGVLTGANRAINQQRTAAGIVNIVSEEQCGAIVDGNIGQALQRLPGLSVDQSQDGSQGSINIRGIAGEFNPVQIDGNVHETVLHPCQDVARSGSGRASEPSAMPRRSCTYVMRSVT